MNNLERSQLFQSIKSLVETAKNSIVRNINTTMLLTYFQIGKMIVEDEQQGKERADYAKETLKNLSLQLTEEFGKGYSVTNLEYFRKFYLTYETRNSQSLAGASVPLVPITKTKK